MSHKKDARLNSNLKTKILCKSCGLTLCILGTLANSEVLDEMWHNAIFHQGLHCLLILK